MSHKFRTILLVGALVLAGCGSDSDEQSATTTSTAPADLETSADQSDGQALIAASVEVDGVVYLIGCTAVSPSSLSDPLGTADYLGEDVSARLLAGVNVSNAIAIEVPGGECGPGDRQLSDWSLAVGQGVDTELATQIACDSGLKAQGC